MATETRAASRGLTPPVRPGDLPRLPPRDQDPTSTLRGCFPFTQPDTAESTHRWEAERGSSSEGHVEKVNSCGDVGQGRGRRDGGGVGACTGGGSKWRRTHSPLPMPEQKGDGKGPQPSKVGLGFDALPGIVMTPFRLAEAMSCSTRDAHKT